LERYVGERRSVALEAHHRAVSAGSRRCNCGSRPRVPGCTATARFGGMCCGTRRFFPDLRGTSAANGTDAHSARTPKCTCRTISRKLALHSARNAAAFASIARSRRNHRQGVDQPAHHAARTCRMRGDALPGRSAGLRHTPGLRAIANHSRTIIGESMNDARSAGASAAVIIGLCFAVAVLEGFDIQAIGVAAPKLAPEFGLTPGQLGWVFSISNIGLVIGASLGGWLADRFGRRPVLIASVLTFGAFTLLTALSGAFSTLFLTRLLAGLGFGAALPNMMAVAAEISKPDKRAITAAATFCGMPIGGGAAALTTQLLPRFDWRVIFFSGGLLPLVVAGALYAFMQETLRSEQSGAQEAVAVLKALFGEGRAAPTALLWLTFLPTLLMLYLFLNWLPMLATANGLDRAVAPQASLAFNFASVPG